MTPEEFSKKVKEKYPQYNSVDDNLLTQKILEKYPQYQSQVKTTTIEPPPTETGIIQDEIQKTGKDISKSFGEAQGFAEKAAVAGTVPLRAVGAGARIVGRAIAEPISPIVEKAISSLSESAREQLGALIEKGGVALDKVKEIVSPDVYQSLVDVVDVASLFGGGKVAKTGAEAVAPVVKGAAEKAIQTGKELAKSSLEMGIEGAKKTKELITSTAKGTGNLADRTIKSLETGTMSGVPKNVDEFIDTSLEKAIRPSVTGKQNASDILKFKEQGRNAVKTIVANKNKLTLTNEMGDTVSKLPESLDEFTQAIQQTKKTIFTQYNDLTKQTGKTGEIVDLNPIANEVKKIADNPVLSDTNPNVVQYAEERVKALEKRGTYTPEQTEEAIKIYNQSLEAFYRNPDYANASKAAIDALIVNNMRKSLENVIENATGKEYQTLKNQYGALKSIEKDTVRRTIVEARKNVKGLIDYTDILSGGEAIAGILTMNPALMAKAATQNGIKEFFKRWVSPDATIKRMFEGVESAMVK